MRFRIAFDLDGVFADMEGELVRQAEILFGEAMTRQLKQHADTSQPSIEPPTTSPDRPVESSGDAGGEPSPSNAPALQRLNMTPRQQRRLWHHVESIENFWQTLTEIEPGVIARLKTIAVARSWEIIFLTKRPETAGATAQVQTQRWLESKGFALPSVFVVQGSRGRIADSLGLDIVVDDRPENCLDVVIDSKARALLVWREDEAQLPSAAKRLGIGVIASVDECLDILTQVDSAGRGKPGLLDRLMRRLGLKESATA
jgi:hypothetical protein